MLIHLGADHRGFALKELLKKLLYERGYEISDASDEVPDPVDDAPLYTAKVAKAVSSNLENTRGILICSSGTAMDIVANKFPGIRSGLALSPDHIFQARNDDDVNILCLASDYTDEETAKKIVTLFLETPFENVERRARRLQEMSDVERDIKIGA